MSAAQARPQDDITLADPAAPIWKTADIAAFLDVSPRQVYAQLPTWYEQGFPRPLPYMGKPLKWRPAAVIKWSKEIEEKTGAMPRDVRAI